MVVKSGIRKVMIQAIGPQHFLYLEQMNGLPGSISTGGKSFCFDTRRLPTSHFSY